MVFNKQRVTFMIPHAIFMICAIMTMFLPIGLAEAQEKPSIPAIDTGIPKVTPEQAVDKFKSIVMSVYSAAVEFSPYMTLFILIVGGILGIMLRWARTMILWAVVGMIVILWAPQLVGLVEYFKTL